MRSLHFFLFFITLSLLCFPLTPSQCLCFILSLSVHAPLSFSLCSPYASLSSPLLYLCDSVFPSVSLSTSDSLVLYFNLRLCVYIPTLSRSFYLSFIPCFTSILSLCLSITLSFSLFCCLPPPSLSLSQYISLSFWPFSHLQTSLSSIYTSPPPLWILCSHQIWTQILSSLFCLSSLSRSVYNLIDSAPSHPTSTNTHTHTAPATHTHTGSSKSTHSTHMYLN